MVKNRIAQRTTRTWINLSVIAAALAVVTLGLSPLHTSHAQDGAATPQEDRPTFDDRPRLREGRDNMREGMRGMRRPDGEQRPQGGRGGRPGDGEYMPTDEEIEQAMDVLREYDPKVAAHAESLRATNPDRYRVLIRRYMPQIRRLMYIKEAQPESYETHLEDARLGAECERIARELGEAGGKSDDLRKQLREAVTRHFDLRQQMKEKQLANLEQAVLKLREQLKKRLELKPQLIDERMDELTGQRDDRMW